MWEFHGGGRRLMTRRLTIYVCLLSMLALLSSCRSPGVDRADFHGPIHAETYAANSHLTTNEDFSSQKTPPSSLPVTEQNRQEISHAPSAIPSSPGNRPWSLTLIEARRIAMKNNKEIAYVRYLPLEKDATIESEDAIFDTVFEFGGTWNRYDRQVSNVVESLGSIYSSTTNNMFNNAPDLPDTIALSKRLRTGGTFRVSQGANYDMVNPVGNFVLVNPYWFSSTNFTLEHPLLQGRGVDVNRLGICIAQANCQESTHKFQATVHSQLRTVELAYWQLYYAYEDLASRRTAVIYSLKTWEKEKEKLQLGEGCIPDVAQARQQYEKFRIKCNTAEKNVLVEETSLRRLLGIPGYDGRRILVADKPTKVELVVNWDSAVDEAMKNRPELGAQRKALQATRFELSRAQNGLLPDVKLVAGYSMTGLDDNYGQSIRWLVDGNYNDWTLGFVYRKPIGNRPAKAAARQAKAAVGREYALLQRKQHDVRLELQAVYQELISEWRALPLYRARLDASAIELSSRQELYSMGEVSVDLYLRTQADYTESERELALGITRYNQAIAKWEFTKGTIMQHCQVFLPEKVPLPQGTPLPKDKNRSNAENNSLRVTRLPPIESIMTR